MGMGGGSKTATNTSGIDPEFKPYLKEVLGDVTDRYKDERAGKIDTVAGLNPVQAEAMAAQANLGRDQARGLTDEQMARQLAKAQANTAFQQQGALGSAKAGKAREAALLDAAINLQSASDARRGQGVQQLGQTGSTLQTQKQRELDAPHTSAQRYFGYLQGAPQQSTSSQPGGK